MADVNKRKDAKSKKGYISGGGENGGERKETLDAGKTERWNNLNITMGRCMRTKKTGNSRLCRGIAEREGVLKECNMRV